MSYQLVRRNNCRDIYELLDVDGSYAVVRVTGNSNANHIEVLLSELKEYKPPRLPVASDEQLVVEEPKLKCKRDKLVLRYCKMIAQANIDCGIPVDTNELYVMRRYHYFNKGELLTSYSNNIYDKEAKFYCTDKEALIDIGQKFSIKEMHLIVTGVEL